MSESLYLPERAEIVEARMVTPFEKLFTLRLADGRPLGHVPCQFVEVSVLGIGEAPISVSSPPYDSSTFELCIRATGNVTNALHTLVAGDSIGIRGPFGQGVDASLLKGKDLVFVAGGIGLVPLRSLIGEVMNTPEDYGNVSVLYGAKDPAELLFSDEIDRWRSAGATCDVTVDRGDEGWDGHVGVVTTLMTDMDIDPETTVAFIVGPPIMYKFVLLELVRKGMHNRSIQMSLERRMKCGVGKCGHCQINGVYVCKEGPVFSYSQAEKLTEAV
jgi:sulfhydrogenase subunit gamma (sulfur reductase)